jgi:hypothetical protein
LLCFSLVRRGSMAGTTKGEGSQQAEGFVLTSSRTRHGHCAGMWRPPVDNWIRPGSYVHLAGFASWSRHRPGPAASSMIHVVHASYVVVVIFHGTAEACSAPKVGASRSQQVLAVALLSRIYTRSFEAGRLAASLDMMYMHAGASKVNPTWL